MSAADPLLKQINRSREELRAMVGNYQYLLDQLSRVEQAIAEGKESAGLLTDLEKAFYRYPRLAVKRAVAETDDGLEETHALLIELRNKIIVLSQDDSDAA